MWPPPTRLAYGLRPWCEHARRPTSPLHTLYFCVVEVGAALAFAHVAGTMPGGDLCAVVAGAQLLIAAVAVGLTTLVRPIGPPLLFAVQVVLSALQCLMAALALVGARVPTARRQLGYGTALVCLALLLAGIVCPIWAAVSQYRERQRHAAAAAAAARSATDAGDDGPPALVAPLLAVAVTGPGDDAGGPVASNPLGARDTTGTDGDAGAAVSPAPDAPVPDDAPAEAAAA